MPGIEHLHQLAGCLAPQRPLVNPQEFDDYLHQACVGSQDRDTRWRLLTQWAKAPGGKEVGEGGCDMRLLFTLLLGVCCG